MAGFSCTYWALWVLVLLHSLPRDAEALRKIVVDLAEQLDRSLAEQNKYQSLLRELLEVPGKSTFISSVGWRKQYAGRFGGV